MAEQDKKRPATEQPEDAPIVKKPKLEVIKAQIEYYMSDVNLKHDQFFHSAITNSEGGWLEIEHFMNCNKIRALGCTPSDVVMALDDSELEVNEKKTAIRRTEGTTLPTLEEKPRFEKKAKDVHASGIIACVKNVPRGVRDQDVKEAIMKAFVDAGKFEGEAPKKMTWGVRKSESEFIYAFDINPVVTREFLDNLEIKVNEHTLKVQIPDSEEARKSLILFPKHIRDKRNKIQGEVQKKNYPVTVDLGGQKFTNEGALRMRVKRIQLSRSNGEELKKDSGDFLLMMDLIKFHPDPKKTMGVTGMKVDLWDAGCSASATSFYIIKEDGTTDNISMKKCFENLKEKLLAKEPRKPDAQKKGGNKGAGKGAEVQAAEGETNEVKQEDKAPAASAEEGASAETKVEEAKENAKASEIPAEEPKIEKVESETEVPKAEKVEPKEEECKTEEAKIEKVESKTEECKTVEAKAEETNVAEA